MRFADQGEGELNPDELEKWRKEQEQREMARQRSAERALANLRSARIWERYHEALDDHARRWWHRRGPYPPWQRVYRDAKTGKLGLRELWGVVGGTWQRTPDTGDQWSDERRLRPRSTGGVIVEYDPIKGAVRVAA
jgi:hypothetical protein